MTIAGAPFPRIHYHFSLAFSGWQYVKAIQGGESFTALTEGMQEALRHLGGAPKTHRTDRLPADYRNLVDEDDAAAGYNAFCAHDAIESTRNNAGVSHENGSVEAAHGDLKTTLSEALNLRGSRNFEDSARYQRFLAEVTGRRNARRRAELALELEAMAPLPKFKTTDVTLASTMVTRSGTICVTPNMTSSCRRRCCGPHGRDARLGPAARLRPRARNWSRQREMRFARLARPRTSPRAEHPPLWRCPLAGAAPSRFRCFRPYPLRVRSGAGASPHLETTRRRSAL